MNWGTNIVIGLGSFMLMIVCFCLYMISNDTDTLEEQDYYEQGLNYDATYAKRQNLVNCKALPQVSIRQDSLRISFKEGPTKGILIFKMPADAAQDLRLPFETVEKLYVLPLAIFKKGMWHLSIDWQTNNQLFLSEHKLYLE